VDPTILRFLAREYFHRTGSEILNENETSLSVRLTREADLELGYRPMYWSFVDTANLIPELLEKTYRFYSPENPASDRPIPPTPYSGGEEWLTPTSERLRRIFRALVHRGTAIRLFEHKRGSEKERLLNPWYAFTVRVRFFREIAREFIASYGYDAVRGQIVPQFWERILGLELGNEPPSYVRLLPSMHRSEGASRAVVNYILEELKGDLAWAEEALARLAEEMRWLDRISFSESPFKKSPQSEEVRWEVVSTAETTKPKPEEPTEPEFGLDSKGEREDLLRRFLPRIRLTFVQAAVVYLASNPRDLPIDELTPEALREFARRLSARSA